jgi:hypothetical protein
LKTDVDAGPDAESDKRDGDDVDKDKDVVEDERELGCV